jgi:hypothetical protein
VAAERASQRRYFNWCAHGDQRELRSIVRHGFDDFHNVEIDVFHAP